MLLQSKGEKMRGYRPLIRGSVASLGLISLYFVILMWANSFKHATDQFLEMWYWILILSMGFGIQVGLYTHIKGKLHKKMMESKAELAATGGISTASMAACCAHHIVDILPLLGVSAAATFLLKYQLSFILVGVLSNILGIISMLDIMQKHNVNSDRLSTIYRYDLKKVKTIGIYVAILIASLSFVLS